MIRHIFWCGFPGQSNCWGTNPGGSGSRTLAAVRYYGCLIGTTPLLTATLDDLNDTHGKDYEFGNALNNAGMRVIIVNVCRGSTYSNMWIPGGDYYDDGLAEYSRAWGLIQAAYPTDTFLHHHVVDQGEAEIRYPTSGIPSLWAENVAESHASLETLVGEPMTIWVNETNPNMDAVTFAALMYQEQLTAAGSLSHFLIRSGYEWETGGLHLTTPGYVQNGRELAAMVISGIHMGTLSPYARTKLVDHVRNEAAYSAAATHYLHLYADAGLTVPLTSGTASGYAAASATNNTTTWPTPASRAVSNGVAFTFTPTGTWPDTYGWKLTDSATEGAGNLLASHTLITPVPASVATGPIAAGVGAITISAATNLVTGGATDAVIHGLLGLMFGGTAYAALATDYGSHWAGDPAGAGAQAGSRVAITQATAWGAASSGQDATVANVSLTQQATGTYWAEHDAAAAGNLLFTAPRPAAVGASGTILAGQVLTTFT